MREILLAKYLNVRGLRKNKIFILQQSTAGTCSWALASMVFQIDEKVFPLNLTQCSHPLLPFILHQKRKEIGRSDGAGVFS